MEDAVMTGERAARGGDEVAFTTRLRDAQFAEFNASRMSSTDVGGIICAH